MPILYNKDKLSSSEYKRIRKSLGGSYSFLDIITKGAVGSPLFQYNGGHEEIDQLNDRCSDALRINLELLKNGMIIWVAERTRSYFIATGYNEFFIESASGSGAIRISIHLADGQTVFLSSSGENKKAWDVFNRKVIRLNKKYAS